MDREFLKKRIEATKTQIVEAEEAIGLVASGAVQSYTIDTGQTTQTVSNVNLATYRIYLDGLYNRLATLQARLCGASTYGRAGF